MSNDMEDSKGDVWGQWERTTRIQIRVNINKFREGVYIEKIRKTVRENTGYKIICKNLYIQRSVERFSTKYGKLLI